VFENWLIRRTYEPKMDELIGGYRKLHNEELHSFNSSPNIIRMIKSRRMGLAGHIARMEETINAYKMLVQKPLGKRPLKIPKRIW
jgi:hypothetical protein